MDTSLHGHISAWLFNKCHSWSISSCPNILSSSTLPVFLRVSKCARRTNLLVCFILIILQPHPLMKQCNHTRKAPILLWHCLFITNVYVPNNNNFKHKYVWSQPSIFIQPFYFTTPCLLMYEKCVTCHVATNHGVLYSPHSIDQPEWLVHYFVHYLIYTTNDRKRYLIAAS